MKDHINVVLCGKSKPFMHARIIVNSLQLCCVQFLRANAGSHLSIMLRLWYSLGLYSMLHSAHHLDNRRNCMYKYNIYLPYLGAVHLFAFIPKIILCSIPRRKCRVTLILHARLQSPSNFVSTVIQQQHLQIINIPCLN